MDNLTNNSWQSLLLETFLSNYQGGRSLITLRGSAFYGAQPRKAQARYRQRLVNNIPQDNGIISNKSGVGLVGQKMEEPLRPA